jgi:hypothetical protein
MSPHVRISKNLMFSPMAPSMGFRGSSNMCVPVGRDSALPGDADDDDEDGAALALVTVKTELHESEEDREEREEVPLNLAASTTSL